jgi:glycerate-2-kinase
MDMNFDGDIASEALAKIKSAFSEKYKDNNVFLFGGETVLSLPKRIGKGGRNQHLTALFMKASQEIPGNWAMTAISSDGSDYIKGIAGAIIDNNTINEITDTGANIDAYIKNFDSHSLFKKIDSALIKMDNTGTNIGDLVVVVKGSLS